MERIVFVVALALNWSSGIVIAGYLIHRLMVRKFGS